MDILKVYKEVYRVLNPGALFVESAWPLTEKFQPGNPEHENYTHVHVHVHVCYSLIRPLVRVFGLFWMRGA